MQKQEPIKSIRLLTFWLIISGALNVTLFVSFLLKKPVAKEEIYVEKTAAISSESIEKYINESSHQSYDELVKNLKDVLVIEQGVKKRDVALSALVQFHYVDLFSLISFPFQQRVCAIEKMDGKSEEFILYVGGDDGVYTLLHKALSTKSCPFTVKGLYTYLQKKEKDQDALIYAFSRTDFFLAFQQLFSSHFHGVEDRALIALLTSIQWETLEKNYEQMHIYSDFSKDRLFGLLLEGVERKSATACEYLLKISSDFLLKHASDKTLLWVIEENWDAAQEFGYLLRQLLVSLRNDLLREKAGKRLYALTNQYPAHRYSHEEAIRMFCPTAVTPAVEQSKSQWMWHIVQRGETLWSLSKRYDVSIENLVRLNHLSKDEILHVGQKLKISQVGQNHTLQDAKDRI